MSRHISSLAFAALLLWAGTALAQQAQQPQAQLPPERMMAQYPAGWVAQAPVRQDALTAIRMLPPGQSAQDYEQAITLERYEGDHRAPKEFVLGRAEQSRASCDGMLASEVVEGKINGYRAASLRFTCTRSNRNNKSGAVSITAVSGRDALHVVAWFWLGAPVAANQLVPVPPQVINQWDGFQRTITICDIRDVSHPCPVAPPR